MSDNETTEEILEDIQEPEIASLASSSLEEPSPFLPDLECPPGFFKNDISLHLVGSSLEDGDIINKSQGKHREMGHDIESGPIGLQEEFFSVNPQKSNTSEKTSSDIQSVSPSLSSHSDGSVKSCNDGSDPHNDRSLSEVSVTFPKLTVVAIGSNQRVSSLVKQFSHCEDQTGLNETKDVCQLQSLPPYITNANCSSDLSFQPTSFTQQSSSLQDDFVISKSRGNVAKLVSHYSLESNDSVWEVRRSKCGKSSFLVGELSPTKKIADPSIASADDKTCSQNIPERLDADLPLELDSVSIIGLLENNSDQGGDTSKLHLHNEPLGEEVSFPEDMATDEASFHNDVTFNVKKYNIDSASEADGHIAERRPSVHGISSFDIQDNLIAADSDCGNLDLLCSIAFPPHKHDHLSPQERVNSLDKESSLGFLSKILQVSKDEGVEAIHCEVSGSGNALSKDVSRSRMETECEGVWKFDDELDSKSSRNREYPEELSKSICPSPGSQTENDTCEELLEIDIGEFDQDLFNGDLSDASEIILGLISKSPISAITERTEESGQENEMGKSASDETEPPPENENMLGVGDKSQAPISNKTENALPVEATMWTECQTNDILVTNEGQSVDSATNLGYFHIPFVNTANDVPSSQFTGISSMQGESLLQMQPSLDTTNLTNLSSSPNTNELLQKKKACPKPKWTKIMPNSKLPNKQNERSFTPPPGRSVHGPVKPSLHRITSKSMHNLGPGGSGIGMRARCQRGLQNRSFSLSTDLLESQSPRAKSLSPGPLPEQRRRLSDTRSQGGLLTRRCVSAVALDRSDSQSSIRRNQSVSLGRLNHSRSSSMTSVASWKKADYSHITSKVKQYIKDMKDKDLKRSTKSLPTTPAKKPSTHQDVKSKKFMDEVLLRELSDLDDKEIPETVLRLKALILKDKNNIDGFDELLRLWALERKLRYASDTTLATLQEHYDNLNALYAEKQNEIDRLRFYRDIHIYKGYNLPSKVSDNKKHIGVGGKYSCQTSPPNTPHRSFQHFLSSPNTPTRRSSLHTTPPNTPNVRSLSPTNSGNLVKSASASAAELTWSLAHEPNESSNTALATCTGVSPKEVIEDNASNITLEEWIQEANTVLKRVKEFALLEGSSALQQSERNLIWQSILTQYWRLSSHFPILSLLPDSQQSGQLVQSLGQAISGTASRFDLNLMPYSNPTELEVSAICVNATESLKKSFQEKRTAEVVGEADTKNGSNLVGTGCKTQEQTCYDHPSPISHSRSNTNQCSISEAKRKQLESTKKKKAISQSETLTRRHGQKAAEENKDHGKTLSELKKNISVPDPSKESHQNLGNTRVLDNTSPAPSQESMKTVGPLEKVTMWQESLIGSAVLHTGSYQSSSDLSPAPSLMSLGSSQPFDPTIPLDNCLDDIQLRGAPIGHVDDVAAGNELSRSLTGQKNSIVDSGSNSVLNFPERLEGEFARSTWRSTGGTPRLALGRVAVTAKARDLDSGCPGSERSTKISHNASLEHPDHLDAPKCHLNVTESNVIPNCEPSDHLGAPQIFSGNSKDAAGEANVEHTGMDRYRDVGNKFDHVSSDSLMCQIKDSESKPIVLLDSKDGMTVAGVGARASLLKTVAKAGRSSSSNSSFKLDYSSDVENNYVKGRKVKRGDSVSSTKSNWKGIGDISRQHSVKAAVKCRDLSISDCKDSLTSSRNKKQLNTQYDVNKKEGKISVRAESPSLQVSKQKSLHKFDTKYISGSSSESSSCRSNASLDVVNNISRLKRDLNILKSQMLNLTTEVRQDRNKTKSHCARSPGDTKSGIHKPMKASAEVLVTPAELHSSTKMPSNMNVTKSSSNMRYKDRKPSYKPGNALRTSHPPSRLQDPNSDEDACQQHYTSDPAAFSDSYDEVAPSDDPDLAVPRSPCGSPKKQKKKNGRTKISPGESSQGLRSDTKSYLEQDVENVGMVNSEHSCARVPRLPLMETINKLACSDAKHALLQTANVVGKGHHQSCAKQKKGKSISKIELAVSPHNELGAPSSPIIYIQNYNCCGENMSPEGEKSTQAQGSKSYKSKHRRHGSFHNLMASLDQATTLAERLRLRSESMLTHINLNLSAQYDFGKS